MQKKKLPNLFMISLERSASIVFPGPLPNLFYMIEKKIILVPINV